jgi:hypothetical protein
MAEDCRVAHNENGAIVGWAYPENATGGPRDFIEGVRVATARRTRPAADA